ncbi:DNA-binding transcriptional regulator, MocR family, contains an aminotransferase domain [Microbacterium sp. ru370.1]|uniref:aminotransferase class I/II-fold pyridoxal phosphate-dependent enzyme n=1 Tax=unclassified Microbacterium TaxID=2609290 RepID=UPI00088BB964|nr:MULTISPECIES: aminotransferase class I/II-fold pyridoxal phosphate-dependent enzyme [unclassified Microbacterium]SDP02762.1 DNA-binding transcriptional regulator, MocR family, contains an aminotransferase domain [Microbacterium sp. ru370.1]SIT91820.1 DNA-binding transcriptional regulator, MocR family, contains an aminotransferase domain [Microbacterium sp. RU1D]
MLSTTALSSRSAAGLAAEIARLVTDGTLEPGERLPTVRQVASDLGLSTGTIAAAWRALAEAGVVTSRGRAGTFVRAPRREWLSPRVRGLAAVDAPPAPPAPRGLGGRVGAGIRLDLSLGTPDPAMLPSIERALSLARPRADTGRYHDLPVLPELHDVLVADWPVPTVEALTVVDGAFDGISRAVDQVVRFGDRVAVESPGFPYIFDLVDATGAVVLPLESDADGILPAALARALAQRPSTLMLQTRAQNPTGVSMSVERARRLADVLLTVPGGRAVTVIEDDHSALIATAPAVTLARWIPAQVVHVRGFSKSHGPDLRIAALGGPADIVERIVRRRMLGPGWTSRLLQSVLLELLTDPRSIAPVRTARLIYRDRLDRLAASLGRLGIDVGAPDGINLWMPVRDERAALVYLAAEGIAVAGGRPFLADPAPAGQFVRVTAGAITENVRLVAEALARAAAASPLS